jgi:hypothetical protein
MMPVMGDGNGEGEAKGCNCFRRGRGGGEATRWCQTRMTQGRARAAVGEPEGGSWRLDVEDDQIKLRRWAECAIELNY